MFDNLAVLFGSYGRKPYHISTNNIHCYDFVVLPLAGVAPLMQEILQTVEKKKRVVSFSPPASKAIFSNDVNPGWCPFRLDFPLPFSSKFG